MGRFLFLIETAQQLELKLYCKKRKKKKRKLVFGSRTVYILSLIHI